MANEIRLVTYANQQVTPQNDAVLTNLETPNNGIIFGCEISIKNASTLHINSGMGVIYGREFEIVDSDISVPLPGAGTELGQLYIHIDLANTSAPVQLLIETGASLTPMVDDANLNVTTGITEYQLATFNVSTATISDLVVTFKNTKDIRTELGTADISGIGDGSVKGAISRINSDLSSTNTNVTAIQNGLLTKRDSSYITPFADFVLTNDIGEAGTVGDIACTWKVSSSHGCNAKVLNNNQTPWIEENLGACLIILEADIFKTSESAGYPLQLKLNEVEILKPWLDAKTATCFLRQMFIVNMTAGSYFYMIRKMGQLGYISRLIIIKL